MRLIPRYMLLNVLGLVGVPLFSPAQEPRQPPELKAAFIKELDQILAASVSQGPRGEIAGPARQGNNRRFPPWRATS